MSDYTLYYNDYDVEPVGDGRYFVVQHVSCAANGSKDETVEAAYSCICVTDTLEEALRYKRYLQNYQGVLYTVESGGKWYVAEIVEKVQVRTLASCSSQKCAAKLKKQWS